MSSSSVSSSSASSTTGPAARQRRTAISRKTSQQVHSGADIKVGVSLKMPSTRSGRRSQRRRKRALASGRFQAPAQKSAQTSVQSPVQRPAKKRPRRPGQKTEQKVGQQPARKPARAPKPVRQLVRWLVRGSNHSSRKVLMAGGSVATLAAFVIVPTRVSSEAIALSNCQEVVQSGAEVSRGQIAGLLAIPEGSRRDVVRQVIDVPYCLLPAVPAGEVSLSTSEPQAHKREKSSDEAASQLTEREAYPLAFDPKAWVVVSYTDGEYRGYDFVFKR